MNNSGGLNGYPQGDPLYTSPQESIAPDGSFHAAQTVSGLDLNLTPGFYVALFSTDGDRSNQPISTTVLFSQFNSYPYGFEGFSTVIWDDIGVPLTFTMTFTTDDANLTAAPEPNSAALLGGVVVAFLFFGRKRLAPKLNR